MAHRKESVVLLIHCKDRRGIVARVSGFIHDFGGNILDSDHHTDEETNEFLMRMEFAAEGLQIPPDEIAAAFAPVAKTFEMRYEVRPSSHRTRVAMLVSKQDHCLADLLQRHKRDELHIDIPVIISNHDTCAGWAELFKIPFSVCPVTKETKPQQEQQVLVPAERPSYRTRGHGSVHANSQRHLSFTGRLSGHQYPSLLPARFHRRQSLPAGL